jgi:hypothetical protein
MVTNTDSMIDRSVTGCTRCEPSPPGETDRGKQLVWAGTGIGLVTQPAAKEGVTSVVTSASRQWLICSIYQMLD